MMLLPLAGGMLLILDPFVDVYDVDLEMMRYRPNNWPLIPMFVEVIRRSKRLPADYDMSHMLAIGAGCEAFNNKQLRNVEEFLKQHNCNLALYCRLRQQRGRLQRHSAHGSVPGA